MDCRDAQRFAQLRVDDEMEPLECAQLDLHLEDCGQCRERVQHEAWFQAKLKATLRASACRHADKPPEHLRLRVLTQLHEEDTSADAFPIGRAVAASFATLLLVGLTWGAASSPATPYDETVKRHSSNLPPEVRAVHADGSDVHRFFQSNLRYPVQVPNVARSNLPVRLVGARLSNIHDRDAAYVMYDHRGAKLSLFAYPSNEPLAEIEGFERRSVGERELFVGNRQGYNVVSWKDRDVVYSLVSDVDPGELVQLAGSMR